MIITKKVLPRRTFLRGLGAAVAVDYLARQAGVVQASVNLATEKARVAFDPAVVTEALGSRAARCTARCSRT